MPKTSSLLTFRPFPWASCRLATACRPSPRGRPRWRGWPACVAPSAPRITFPRSTRATGFVGGVLQDGGKHVPASGSRLLHRKDSAGALIALAHAQRLDLSRRRTSALHLLSCPSPACRWTAARRAPASAATCASSAPLLLRRLPLALPASPPLPGTCVQAGCRWAGVLLPCIQPRLIAPSHIHSLPCLASPRPCLPVHVLQRAAGRPMPHLPSPSPCPPALPNSPSPCPNALPNSPSPCPPALPSPAGSCGTACAWRTR